MTHAPLPFQPAGIHGQPTPDSVRDALTATLALPAPVTALFCGTTGSLPARPATAGRPMAVVGFDDFESAELDVLRRDGRRAKPGRDG